MEGIVDILRKYESVIVIEEHSERGGLGSQVKQVAWEHRAECSLDTFGLKDEFIHVYGTPADLWEAHGLNVNNILERTFGR